MDDEELDDEESPLNSIPGMATEEFPPAPGAVLRLEEEDKLTTSTPGLGIEVSPPHLRSVWSLPLKIVSELIPEYTTNSKM